MAMQLHQNYDFETLIGRQQYWRNEFRSQMGRAVADANGLIYSHYDVRMGYPVSDAKIGGKITAPYPVVTTIVSVCFDPADTEHQKPIRVEWPKDFVACYALTEKWVKAGGEKPVVPILLPSKGSRHPFTPDTKEVTARVLSRLEEGGHKR